MEVNFQIFIDSSIASDTCDKQKGVKMRRLKKTIGITLAGTLFFSQFMLGTMALPVNCKAKEKEEVITTKDLEQYENNELIVCFKEDTKQKSICSLVTKQDAKDDDYLDENSVLLQFDSKQEVKEALKELEKDSSVAYVQPNYTYSTLYEKSDTDFKKQWALYNDGTASYKKVKAQKGIDINMLPAWEYMKDKEKSPVLVAVVDTGIDYLHKDLEAGMWKNEKEIEGNGIDDDNNGYIDDVNGWNSFSDNNRVTDRKKSTTTKEYYNNHGTHVAGIINAQGDNQLGIAGIACENPVKLISSKGLGGALGTMKGMGSTSSIAKAIVYAEKNGARICNMSLGGLENDRYLYDLMKKSDMLFIVAAGNSSYDIDKTPIYPAAYNLDNIVSVANIQCDGTLHESSCYGAKNVDIAAPGSEIYSTTEVDHYDSYIGTSMATPMVTGAASVLLSCNPELTNDQIKTILIASAKPNKNLKNKVLSGGMLDVYQALVMADQGVAPTIETKISNIKASNHKKVTIKVSEGTSKVVKSAYAMGTKDAAYFKEESASYTDFTNQATITVKKSSVYTIYTQDEKGNETIKIVKVTVLFPTKVTLNVTNKTMKQGSTFTLKANVLPKGVYTKLRYTSSNKKVATVTQTGKIYAKKKGSTVITVITENGKKTACKITVK